MTNLVIENSKDLAIRAVGTQKIEIVGIGGTAKLSGGHGTTTVIRTPTIESL